MANRLICACGLLLLVVSVAFADEPSPDQTVANGKYRVQVMQGSFSAVFDTSVLETLLVPTGAVESHWLFSDGKKMQRIKYYFPTLDRTPPLKMSDEDVARMARHLEPRLGKEKALQFARGMQQQLATDVPRRVPRMPRFVYLPYHVKYDGEQSPAHIDFVEDVDSVIPKDGPKIGLKRTYRGILRRERNGTYHLCISRSGEPRPIDFKIADDDPHVLIRLYF